MQGQHTSHRKYIYSSFSPTQQVWPETNTITSSLMWQKNTPPNAQRSVLEADVIRWDQSNAFISICFFSWKRQDDTRSPEQKPKQCFLAKNEGGHIHKEIGSGTDAVWKWKQEQSTGIALMSTALISHTATKNITCDYCLSQQAEGNCLCKTNQGQVSTSVN